jgi:glyoxylase-like metal-dependent hydrolase (beta-lactamase superfamily II)
VRPDEVTHVIITHAHWDHFHGITEERDGRQVPRFAHARHYVHRADWEQHPQRADPDSDVMMRLGAIHEAGLLELIDGDLEIAPDIDVMHAPVESPGHCVVRVTSSGNRFYALGDLIHHSLEVEHPGWTRNAHDREALQSSRQRIYGEMASTAGIGVFSHALLPGWGRVVATNSGYRWEAIQMPRS